MNSLGSGVIRINFDIPCELHRKFKTLVVSEGKTAKEVLINYIELYVEEDSPGEEAKKKPDNPGEKMKSAEELAVEILEARKAQAVIVADKVEKAEKLLEIHTTKEPAEEPVKEPVEEPVKEPVEEPIEEPVKEVVEEPAKVEEEPAKEVFGNPGKERRKKHWWDKIPYPPGFGSRRKK